MAKKGFWQKAFSVIGLEPTEMEEEYYETEDEMEEMVDEKYEQEEPIEDPAENFYERPSFSSRRSKIINMPEQHRNSDGSTRVKMVIFRPNAYEESQDIIDALKSRKSIILNLDEIDVRLAQRILDFVSGAVYALAGDIKKAARNIFVVAPSNVDVASSIEDEQDNEYSLEENAL